MAEIVAGLAGPVIEVVKWAAKPITRQFNYLCCYSSNINSLKREAEELDLVTRGLQEKVDRERENVRVIVPEVESWLTKSKDVNDQKDTILDEVPNVKSGCLKLAAWFSLSKRAKETTYLMKELRVQRNFDAISQPGPPAATHEILLGKNTYEFESRKKIEEEIMATLRDGAANVIGICGMGGLGKTTMAQRIMNRVLKEHVVEEVAMAVVSQQVDNSNIQVEIGGSLGLNLQHDTSQLRIQKLHARLSGTKRILIVLDDIWEGLKLEGLGIPCDSKGCKILVTSRNKDALSEMDVQKVFGMEILSVEEAWFLFRERVGTYVDDANLNPIAKEVVDECGGLPIALTAVGAALKDEKDECIWKDALRQLRQCDEDILNFIGKVYNPLKLSYDFLRSQQAKSLLLLCSLFPEDANIRLDRLTYCCIGLGIFEGTINLEGARNKMRALAKMLKSRSLLLDVIFGDNHVRMHDVVRDVCTIIAKNEKYIGGNDCAWISSSGLIGERSEFRTGLGFPNLRLFLLIQNSKSEEDFKFDSVFLEVVRDLHVLWIENSTLTLLPHATQPLKNLNTLVLNSCRGLKTISVVGELVNLKILICWFCHSLEELPPEIKRLNRLKCLELVGCRSLQSIGRGIISSLVGLEQLKMSGSFKKWEAEDRKERENAGLGELQALTNLTSLEIEIEDAALVAENMPISKKLERFHITFDGDDFLPNEFYMYDKRMSLCLERETCLGYWIEMQLLRETESLSLRGNGAKDVDLGKSQNIKCLRLINCETTKNVVTTPCDDVDATVFPASLKYMGLHSLPQLQEISISFQNLSSIVISDCPRLPNLAKLSIAGKDCLSQLEKLHIERCEMMEQVMLWKEGDNNRNNSESRINSFSKLKEVRLDFLPNLATFCQGIEGIEFPLLTKICVKKCPKRTSMVCSGILGSKENKLGGGSSSSNADIDDDYSSHLFCQSEKVSFGNLEKLEIDKNPFCGHEIPASSSYSGLTKLKITNYHGSRSLLSSSIATNLVNLEKLRIDGCDEIVQVIKDDDEEPMAIHGGERKTVLFPKLEELQLADSPKLVSFCELKCDVVLPSLRELEISKCPKMKNLSLGFLAAPNLEEFRTDFNHHLEVGVHALFDRLKILSINDVGSIEYPFYHHKFFIHYALNGLEKLSLYRHPSMSLFPSSIAEKLVNLRSLYIYNCDEMVKVIEEEELEVASGGRRTLLFPKLEELRLGNLPKLVSFCERKCGVELPSLRQVGIDSCPIMKSFNLGPLIAPNLKYIYINFEDIGGEKDLNGALQQQYSPPAKEKEVEEEKKEKKKKKEEGGEEAQKSKGEIEEDQN